MLGPGGGKSLKTLASVGAFGIELLVATTIGFLGGRWLDRKLGTDPWIGLLGLLLGLTAGFRNLIRTIRKAQREQDDEER